MKEKDFLATQFETQRPRLRSVAYRMLGSFSEADDAVQEAWLRLARTDDAVIENLNAWLPTVVGRICLDLLRDRNSRREDPLESEGSLRIPDLILSSSEDVNPEQHVLLTDAVGIALLVVLETLPPSERLAFVLHDIFAVSFDEIAQVIGKSTEASRQLASRARRKVQSASTTPDPDLIKQRKVVDAFHAASMAGDFEALVAVLDPDSELRVDQGLLNANTRRVRGAGDVASQALMFSQFAPFEKPVLVNGVAGLATVVDGTLFSILALTVRDGKVMGIDILADPDRLAQFDISFLLDEGLVSDRDAGFNEA